jgi:nucleotide-binding universal stress UspA family protein
VTAGVTPDTSEALGSVGSGPVSAYRTVVVGTDGSESSLRAVARAALGEDAYQVLGPAPAGEKVQLARERAVAAGAGDLPVVGNRRLRGLPGRLLGSVPAEATRRSGVDVLGVHTTD